jgi:hypothetical protein
MAPKREVNQILPNLAQASLPLSTETPACKSSYHRAHIKANLIPSGNRAGCYIDTTDVDEPVCLQETYSRFNESYIH